MRKILFLVVFFSCFFIQKNYSQDIIEGKVVGITDGDTFTLLDQSNKTYIIRLAEIDAPERGQAFGKAAKLFLSELIYEKKVKVICVNTDKYQRIIGKVYLGFTYVSEEMITSGLSWHFKKYSKSEYLAKLENIAKKNKLGLWGASNSIAPWEWRKNN